MFVIDGEEQKEYDQVFSFSFSPDGKHWAYGVETGGQQFYMVDGVPGKVYDQIAGNSFSWSPDGLRNAYAAIKEKKVIVVADGKETAVNNKGGVVSDEASRPVFSTDGKHIAFAATSGGKSRVIVDGKAQKEFEKIVGDTIRFSPDGARLAYLAAQGQGEGQGRREGRQPPLLRAG